MQGVATELKQLDETIEGLHSTTCYVEKYGHPVAHEVWFSKGLDQLGEIVEYLRDHSAKIHEVAGEAMLPHLKQLDETIECLEKTVEHVEEECDDDECHKKGLLKLEEIVDLLRNWSANNCIS